MKTIGQAAKSLGKLYWLVLACQFVQTQAAENETSLQTPDLELLEFLGSFETDNGEWIEPESLLTGEFAELLNIAAEMDEASANENAASEEDDQGNDE